MINKIKNIKDLKEAESQLWEAYGGFPEDEENRGLSWLLHEDICNFGKVYGMYEIEENCSCSADHIKESLNEHFSTEKEQLCH